METSNNYPPPLEQYYLPVCKLWRLHDSHIHLDNSNSNLLRLSTNNFHSTIIYGKRSLLSASHNQYEIKAPAKMRSLSKQVHTHIHATCFYSTLIKSIYLICRTTNTSRVQPLQKKTDSIARCWTWLECTLLSLSL